MTGDVRITELAFYVGRERCHLAVGALHDPEVEGDERNTAITALDMYDSPVAGLVTIEAQRSTYCGTCHGPNPGVHNGGKCHARPLPPIYRIVAAHNIYAIGVPK